MFLGNIVSETSIQESRLFNITNSVDDINREIPTLIVGWDFSKRIFNDRKLSILDKNIDKNISWTHSKREKRIEFEKDLAIFVKNAIKSAEKRVNYEYINLLTSNYSEIKKIIQKLTYNGVSYIYISRNSFIYAYIGETIIGIDFNMVDFLNIDRKKVYKILYSNKNIVFFSDDFLTKDIKEGIENNHKIIPYLHAIENAKHG